MNEDKIEEVAKAHGIPLEMLTRAIDWERQSITLQNRRMGPKLRELIAEYSARAQTPGDDK